MTLAEDSVEKLQIPLCSALNTASSYCSSVDYAFAQLSLPNSGSANFVVLADLDILQDNKESLQDSNTYGASRTAFPKVFRVHRSNSL